MRNLFAILIFLVYMSLPFDQALSATFYYYWSNEDELLVWPNLDDISPALRITRVDDSWEPSLPDLLQQVRMSSRRNKYRWAEELRGFFSTPVDGGDVYSSRLKQLLHSPQEVPEAELRLPDVAIFIRIGDGRTAAITLFSGISGIGLQSNPATYLLSGLSSGVGQVETWRPSDKTPFVPIEAFLNLRGTEDRVRSVVGIGDEPTAEIDWSSFWSDWMSAWRKRQAAGSNVHHSLYRDRDGKTRWVWVECMTPREWMLVARPLPDRAFLVAGLEETPSHVGVVSEVSGTGLPTVAIGNERFWFQRPAVSWPLAFLIGASFTLLVLRVGLPAQLTRRWDTLVERVDIFSVIRDRFISNQLQDNSGEPEVSERVRVDAGIDGMSDDQNQSVLRGDVGISETEAQPQAVSIPEAIFTSLERQAERNGQLEGRLSALEAERLREREELAQVRKEESERSSKIDSLEVTKRRLESEIEVLKGELGDARNRIATYRVRKKELKTAEGTLRKLNGRLETERDKLRVDLQNSKSSVTRVEKEVAVLQSEVRKAKSLLEEKHDELRVSKAAAADVLAESQRRSAELENRILVLERSSEQAGTLMDVASWMCDLWPYLRQGQREFFDDNDVASGGLLAFLISYSASGLLLGLVEGKETLQAAMSKNIYMITSRLASSHEGFKLSLSSFDRMVDMTSPFPEEMLAPGSAHQDSKMFQMTLRYMRNYSKVDLSPFYFDVDKDGRVFRAN